MLPDSSKSTQPTDAEISRRTRRALEKTIRAMDAEIRKFSLSPKEELDLYVYLAATLDDRTMAEFDDTAEVAAMGKEL